MKFVILNNDYPELLHWLYQQYPNLEDRTFDEQMKARNESLFGVADFYSSNLRKLGHEAYDIHANNEFMQKAWAREHRVRVGNISLLQHNIKTVINKARHLVARTPLRILKILFRPMLKHLDPKPAWFYDILSFQIRHYRPDVLLVQAMDNTNRYFLKEIKPYVKLLVGQIASPLPSGEDFHCYDLIVSSLPNFIEHFRRMGIPAELNRFAFEPRILNKLKNNKEKIPISFVGSLSSHHQTRINLLEHLCASQHIDIWGQGVESLPEKSLIRYRYQGKAWGLEMYQILHNSKMTLNHHIGVAMSYANNMRLFEATGVGTLLITDWKENLPEIFVPGQEVVAYRTPEECAELIQYYLEHDNERESIARAGQARTLKEHNYFQRMQELASIVLRYL